MSKFNNLFLANTLNSFKNAYQESLVVWSSFVIKSPSIFVSELISIPSILSINGNEIKEFPINDKWHWSFSFSAGAFHADSKKDESDLDLELNSNDDDEIDQLSADSRCTSDESDLDDDEDWDEDDYDVEVEYRR